MTTSKVVDKRVKQKATTRKKGKVEIRGKKTSTIKNGDVIILGFTGLIGSGVTYVAKGFKQVLAESGRYYELSRYIVDKLKKEKTGQSKFTIKEKQNFGNLLREEKGNSFLVDCCLSTLSRSERKKPFTEDTVVLIDGIRNEGEIRSLRAFPNFYLISVHAKEEERTKRLVGENAPRKLFDNIEDFKLADQRDKEEEEVSGQHVNKCNYLSDIIINNDNHLQEGTDNKNNYLTDVFNRYIPAIRAIRNGKLPPDHPPTINETIMTTAYGMSKRSSCEKRKVGAVIAYISEYEKLKPKNCRPEDHIRFTVISSGYNEVPLGTAPCKLGSYEGCYRDYIKKRVATSIKFCPNCGKKIPKRIISSFKSFTDYKCSGCKIEVLNTYLPGRIKESGKLLDMCRALHGEEIAILGLEKRHNSNQGEPKRELVLYTTTFPCNLCANKIVEAGIKRVCYAEPYEMEESKKILENAGVNLLKFEGVKSTAYFRLYS